MPPLVAIALVGAAAWAGYRGYRLMSRGGPDVGRRGDRPTAAPITEPRDMGRLELDPATGEYRLRG